MACSSCGKARAAQSVQRNRNAGTTATKMAQPTTINTIDSQSVKVQSAVSSSPNRTASTRTKV